jgi:acetate---CoA ligase (ADP-forming)
VTVTRDLDPLFEPQTVAIVGVSADPAKWGYWFARDAALGGHRRRVYLVGRSGGELHGLPVHRSLGELPEAPELVVLSVPAGGLEAAVDESLAAGARALVAIAAGFAELGEEGAARERALVERVRAAGALLVGPNCLGVFDGPAELQLASNPLPAGPVGLVSQSGNVLLEIGLLLEDVGLGFSRAVSIGNQADVDATELVVALAGHEGTRVIGVYCEDFRDGRAFVEAARTAGKPVVLLTVGRTEAGRRAARSHTGALTSGRDAVEAACRAGGIHLVNTPRELVDAARALLAPRRPRGRRVGVIGDGGGYGAIASDLLGGKGIELPVLAESTQARLRGLLPPTASTANPVDLAGAGEQDVFSFARSTRALLEAGDVDAVLFTAYFGGYSLLSNEMREREVAVAEQLAEAMSDSGKPLVVHTMYWNTPPAYALRAAGVPVYRAIESAVDAVATLVADGEPVPQLPPTPLPAVAPPLTDTSYPAVRAALGAAGVPFGAARTVRGREEALAAAAELGYPVVLKALGLLHKSDVGGVVLGLHDERELAAALEDVAERLAPDQLSVEAAEDVAAGFELLVGARRDPRFGPLVVVAAGGIDAEARRDTAVALAPVDEAAAEELVRSLASAPLLTGPRGRPALDVAAAARAVAALSRFAAAHPEVAEVEVNPLLVRREGEGVAGLDARIVLVPQAATIAA